VRLCGLTCRGRQGQCRRQAATRVAKRYARRETLAPTVARSSWLSLSRPAAASFHGRYRPPADRCELAYWQSRATWSTGESACSLARSGGRSSLRRALVRAAVPAVALEGLVSAAAYRRADRRFRPKSERHQGRLVRRETGTDPASGTATPCLVKARCESRLPGAKFAGLPRHGSASCPIRTAPSRAACRRARAALSSAAIRRAAMQRATDCSWGRGTYGSGQAAER